MEKNLLIIGAGGHGKVIKEVAEATGVYSKIDFIDDAAEDAIGKRNALASFMDAYKYAIVGIGNNVLRKEIQEELIKLGYEVPVICHPSAYISPSACIKAGTVVEPKAIVNANSTVNEGCIISVGAIVDHDVILEPYAHANAGAICKAGSRIEAFHKLEAGEVVKGY